jgi:hypothetical protein
MKFTLPLYFFLILIASCNNRDNSEEASKKAYHVNCYRYTGNSDTIILKLLYVGQSITGSLVYDLDGKDRNIGTVQGSMKGDVLVADYNFQSEGLWSTRQVAFKKLDSVFIEGYGDIISTDKKTVFRNIDSLSFNVNLKLTEIDCDKSNME